MKGRTWTLIITLISIAFTLMTLTTDGLIGKNLNMLSQHFKAITYGTLILIILLVICTPELTEKTKQLHPSKRKRQ